jgi:hypothetical protein
MVFRNNLATFSHMACFLQADDLPNGGRSCESNFQIPSAAVKALPDWGLNDRVACRVGVLDGKFVHQAVGQIDPTLIFSRDVMHQNKVFKP